MEIKLDSSHKSDDFKLNVMKSKKVLHSGLMTSLYSLALKLEINFPKAQI